MHNFKKFTQSQNNTINQTFFNTSGSIDTSIHSVPVIKNLTPQQDLTRNNIHDSDKSIFSINTTRQWGTTYLIRVLVGDYLELKPNTRIVMLCGSSNSSTDNAHQLLQYLRSLKKYNQINCTRTGNIIQIDIDNNSKISIFSIYSDKCFNKMRGFTADVIIKDTCVREKNVEYVLGSLCYSDKILFNGIEG